MSTDKLANVPDLPSVVQDGVEIHDTHFMDNPVMLRTQAQYAVDAINSVIDDVTALDAKVENYNEAAVLADTGMLERLDTLEDSVSGSYPDGVTANGIRIGLEDGVIDSDGPIAVTATGLTFNGLTVDSDGKIGPQERITGDQHSLSGDEVTYVGGAKVYAGAIIDNVVEVTTGGGVYAPSTSNYGKKAFIVRSSYTAIYDFNIPAYTSVPIGTEWLIVNLSGHTFDVGSLSSLADGAGVRILCTSTGWLLIGPAFAVTTIS